MNTTCNGWPNAETWRVQLHLANNTELAAWCADRAATYANMPVRVPPISKATPVELMAEALSVMVHDRANAVLPECAGDDGVPMLVVDFVDAALARVDWPRLAEHWLDAVPRPAEATA